MTNERAREIVAAQIRRLVNQFLSEQDEQAKLVVAQRLGADIWTCPCGRKISSTRLRRWHLVSTGFARTSGQYRIVGACCSALCARNLRNNFVHHLRIERSDATFDPPMRIEPPYTWSPR